MKFSQMARVPACACTCTPNKGLIVHIKLFFMKKASAIFLHSSLGGLSWYFVAAACPFLAMSTRQEMACLICKWTNQNKVTPCSKYRAMQLLYTYSHTLFVNRLNEYLILIVALLLFSSRRRLHATADSLHTCSNYIERKCRTSYMITKV